MANRLDPELVRRMLDTQSTNPVVDFDPTKITQAVGDGLGLAETIRAKQQSQEDRIRALKEKIDMARKQHLLAQQIGKNNPMAGLAADISPDLGAKRVLEQAFTEKQPLEPRAKNYQKVGETQDEIIMADPANPNDQVRIKAPGVGKKGGKDDAAKNKLTLDIEKERANVIINKAKKALTQTSGWTTGAGALLGKLPGTPARNLRGTIDTIKSNLGFEQLAKMRAASPTGGALGQIAVKELEFLQSAVANLDPDQAEDQVVENLNEVITRYENWLKAVEQAGGEAPGNDQNAPPAGNPGGSPEQRRARIAELRAKRAQGTLR